jgi:hypothetical protein
MKCRLRGWNLDSVSKARAKRDKRVQQETDSQQKTDSPTHLLLINIDETMETMQGVESGHQGIRVKYETHQLGDNESKIYEDIIDNDSMIYGTVKGTSITGKRVREQTDARCTINPYIVSL